MRKFRNIGDWWSTKESEKYLRQATIECVQVVHRVTSFIRTDIEFLNWILKIAKYRLNGALTTGCVFPASDHRRKANIFQCKSFIFANFFNRLLHFEHFKQKCLIKGRAKFDVTGGSFVNNLNKTFVIRFNNNIDKKFDMFIAYMWRFLWCQENLFSSIKWPKYTIKMLFLDAWSWMWRCP